MRNRTHNPLQVEFDNGCEQEEDPEERTSKEPAPENQRLWARHAGILAGGGKKKCRIVERRLESVLQP